ncbi:hypothetical protein KCU62_g6438, partial [Aureobasidium sp. EXF-3399]
MLAHSFLPFLFCFLAQLVSVSSSPLVVERAAATCSAKDIATVKRTTPDAVYFCQWWQQDVRTRSPFMEFSATQVDTLCKCISPVATGPKCRRKRKRSNIEERAEALARTAASCSSEVSKQFTQPYRFCTFYTSYPRTTSPFKQYTASALTSYYNFEESFHDHSKGNYHVKEGHDRPEASHNQQENNLDKHQEANFDKYQETNNIQHKEANNN